jgi:hypothetical protein
MKESGVGDRTRGLRTSGRSSEGATSHRKRTRPTQEWESRERTYLVNANAELKASRGRRGEAVVQRNQLRLPQQGGDVRQIGLLHLLDIPPNQHQRRNDAREVTIRTGVAWLERGTSERRDGLKHEK